MKEIKLTIDGKEVALTKEQIEALGIDVYDGCVCDRSKKGRPYFYINSVCSVSEDKELCCDLDNERYNSGNYFRDESYAKQVALHQKLNNLLRRYSEQNGGDTEWDGEHDHYTIYREKDGDFIVSSYRSMKYCALVYFNSMKAAENAIEEVVKPFMEEHPEFVG